MPKAGERAEHGAGGERGAPRRGRPPLRQRQLRVCIPFTHTACQLIERVNSSGWPGWLLSLNRPES